MATPLSLPLTSSKASDFGSDIECQSPTVSEYGSDFDVEEELLIYSILTQTNTTTANCTKDYDGSNKYGHCGSEQALRSESSQQVLRMSEVVCSVQPSPDIDITADYLRNSSDKGGHEGQSKECISMVQEASTATKSHRASPLPNSEDKQSPLERFRSKPKKPLSVTDLVSPAWCELQYWYNLSRFGRKPQTEAMKRGSRVHKELEDQVHQTIPIQISSKEDALGLRIWNAIHGLRTLKQTGLTRELEIWGIVEGQVVNGVIDEVSYACPDPQLEEALEQSRSTDEDSKLAFGKPNLSTRIMNEKKHQDDLIHFCRQQRKRAYIADVKTRGSKSLPRGGSLRPTRMQLSLYRNIMESLASNCVKAEIIFDRYDVRPLEPFTSSFKRELCRIRDLTSVSDDDTARIDMPTISFQSSEVYGHDNLLALWDLMIYEYTQSVTSFSDILRAEFRYSRTGEVIDSEILIYDAEIVGRYVADEMSWWKGKRETKGVEIEEAYKCRTCNFADECTWREKKIEEAILRHRSRAAVNSELNVRLLSMHRQV